MKEREKNLFEEAALELRVGHLMRVSTYLEMAVLSMWGERRAEITLDMAVASLRGPGPGGPEGPEEDLLVQLRDLVGEARWYHASDDFPAAMARMRVAEDVLALRLVHLMGE